MESVLNARHSRSAAILPPDRLANERVGIIGTGAIGRQVALQLAAAGQLHVELFDHDTVEDVNLGPQGFLMEDIGLPKVEAVSRLMLKMNPDMDIKTYNRKYRVTDLVNTVVFCCVDSIETRQHVWESQLGHAELFIDARMAAEALRVITAYDMNSRVYYPTTLFSEAEAFEGACTARSTIFTSNVAAGIMVEQYSKWLRGFPIEKDVIINLLSMDVIIS
jgi:sulfur carrier protein ThiS adenylyltransferase